VVDDVLKKKQTRREFIKAGSASVAGIAAVKFVRPASGVEKAGKQKVLVRGKVFNDINRDGIQNANEPGIPNVVVSDGLAATQTSADGSYELETTNSLPAEYSKKLIFVTTPAGYLLDSENFYKELSVPLDERTEANFALRKSQSDQRKFNFIFMSDMHVGEGSDKDRKFFLETIEDIRKLNKRIGLDFVASGGDMSYRAMDAYNDSISRLKLDGMPVFNTPGNHDLNEDTSYEGPRKGGFNDYFGPTYYSFDHGGVHFIMLDTTAWIPGIGPHNVVACVDNARDEWLRKDLSYVGKSKPVIIMCHIPIRTTLWNRRSDGPTWQICWEVMNNSEIFDILKDYSVKYIFQGHMHENEHIFEHNIDINSVGAASGTWWQRTGNPYCPDGSPEGYLIVSVDGESILPLYKGTGKDEEYQIAILEPQDSLNVEGRTDIMVNFFYGSEKSQLSYKMDDGSWRELSRTKVAVRDTRISEEQTFWKTDHIWLASEKKQEDDHTITVKVIDRHKRTWIQSSELGST